MRTRTSIPRPAVSTPVVTMLMVLCGTSGVAFAAAASAGTPSSTVPSVAVKYDPQSLTTDAGARVVYRRLLKAAENVCPDLDSGSFITRSATLECRREAVARAVHQIGNARLAAIDAPRVKSG